MINTLIAKEESMDEEYLERLFTQDSKVFNKNYILVEKYRGPAGLIKDCCRMKVFKGICFCHKTLYTIKPYAINFLRTVNAFYEVVVCARIHPSELKQI